VDPFQEFLTHMASQLPDEFFKEEPIPQTQEEAQNAALRAAYLWSLLRLIHEDLNALCRRNAKGILGLRSVQAINRTFEEVRYLVAGTGREVLLGLLGEQELPTHADALVMASLYRSVLRRYRIEHLGEDPFSIS
jgi:hypothetical protein